MSISKGKVSQVIGPVVDVSFENGVVLPTIYDALEVFKKDGTRVILEVQSHVGENSIRAISMDSTDGFTRGMEVTATGTGIKMPVGEKIKGRLFNVVGEAIDGINEVSNEGGLSIHREAPKFDQLSTATEILFTGIKVIDLIDKLNTSQLWHIIHNSFAIFTMNAGLWPFAGTTDTNIIAMGSTFNPYYRSPYRNGSQDYKHYFVGGECKIFCHTDLKYNSSGDIKVTGGYPVAGCFENKPTYECHPNEENVFNLFLKLLNDNKK